MDLLLRPAFWLAAVAAYLAMQLPWPRGPMQLFGALNLGVLALLLGGAAAGAALLVSLAAWSVLVLVRRRRRGALAAYVAAVALVFVLHKLDLGRRAHGASGLPFELLLTLAYSYVALRLVDAGRAVADGARLLDPLTLSGYLFPFHMLIAGPIGVYQEHVAADGGQRSDAGLEPLLEGVHTITTGLFYKLVLAEGLRVFAYGVDGRLEAHDTADSALLFVYLFFDFAGYSLVALGLGRLLGVPTPVNFDRPFLARSLTEFWQRWHASLGRFVRVHIFVPLQVYLVRTWGPRWATLGAFVSLSAAFGFVGLWHGLGLAFLVWGLGLGTCLALEKAVGEHARRSGWSERPLVAAVLRVAGPVYVFAAMTLSLRPMWGHLL